MAPALTRCECGLLRLREVPQRGMLVYAGSSVLAAVISFIYGGSLGNAVIIWSAI
jgi:hypothetical protein